MELEEKQRRRKLNEGGRWVVPEGIDTSEFDFTWRPFAYERPFTHQFGTQWQSTGGPTYIVDESEGTKYENVQHAIRLPDKTNFVNTTDKEIDFDYSWHPNELDPPFIYIFNNGLEYHTPNARLKKYLTYLELGDVPQYTIETTLEDLMAQHPETIFWAVPKNLDTSQFDFTWKPEPHDKPFIHQFGTQWQRTGGPALVIPRNNGTKYHSFQHAIHLPDESKYVRLITDEDIEFDFSWHPDSTEPLYNYVFRVVNQYEETNKGVVEYVQPDAFVRKSMQEIAVRRIVRRYEIETTLEDLINERPGEKFWAVPKDIDCSEFDFNWRPHKHDPPYIHKFGTQWQRTGGPTFVVPGATMTKFQSIFKARKLPDPSKFVKLIPDEEVIFDYSWHPDDTEPPYDYQFNVVNEYEETNRPVIEYPRTGAIVKKTVKGVPVRRIINKYTIETTFDDLVKERPNEKFWAVPKNLNTDKFDFNWRPHKYDPPFIHRFGTQWQRTGGPIFYTPNNNGVKYQSTLHAIHLPDESKYVKLMKDEDIGFDYSWHPDDTHLPHIYQFNIENEYEETNRTVLEYMMDDPVARKLVEGVEVKRTIPKYIIETTLDELLEQHVGEKFWAVPKGINTDEFDFNWRPHKYEMAFLYQFGTQWQQTGGPTFVGPDHNGVKYVTMQHAMMIPDETHYVKIIDEDIDFDYSWHPNANEPPYIYVFYMQNKYQEELEIAVEYHAPGATDRKYMTAPVANPVINKYNIVTTLEDLIDEHPTEIFWALNPDLKYETFDFSWRPPEYEKSYVHVFGNSDSKNLQTFYVNAPKLVDKKIEYNYVGQQQIEVHSTIDMYYIDRGNKNDEQFELLSTKYPQLQKTRYTNSWIDTVARCANKSKTTLFWVLSSDIDYSGFNFNFYPSTWQLGMLHVFGTTHTSWGYTYLVNKDTYAATSKHIRVLEHMSNLNFVRGRKTKVHKSLYDIVVIDHGNKELEDVVSTIENKVPNKKIHVVKYDTDYYKTFETIYKTLPEHREQYVWICSSICDYSNFDYTFMFDLGMSEQLVVFPSNQQKYGDTFLVNVNRLRNILPTVNRLDNYDEINFNGSQVVDRLPAPVVVVNDDTHCDVVKTESDFPYQVFVTSDNQDLNVYVEEPMALWHEDTKNIIINSKGGTHIIAPKEVKNYVKKELYDYPYIITSKKVIDSKPLDIIFLSNGEESADDNIEHLLSITKHLPNRVVELRGIDGRVKSQHAAANAAETPWYFLVNGKLRVNEQFDFKWQPDRLQIAKHYIFMATNPVNGLEYGHQAIVANNKNLTLNTVVKGLDFTMDSEHEVVDMNCGIAVFNTSPWDTWRTAFRETIKLKHASMTTNDTGSKYRLNVWTNIAEGQHAEWSIRGAKDAVKYYEEVNGDFEKLRLSYDWAWLRDRFTK